MQPLQFEDYAAFCAPVVAEEALGDDVALDRHGLVSQAGGLFVGEAAGFGNLEDREASPDRLALGGFHK